LFFNTGPTNTILANVTHPSMRAAGFAVNIFLIHVLGDAISPPIIGAIADFFRVDGKADLKAGFMAVSVTILLAGILWGIGSFFLEPDTAQAPRRLDAARSTHFPPGQQRFATRCGAMSGPYTALWLLSLQAAPLPAAEDLHENRNAANLARFHCLSGCRLAAMARASSRRCLSRNRPLEELAGGGPKAARHF